MHEGTFNTTRLYIVTSAPLLVPNHLVTQSALAPGPIAPKSLAPIDWQGLAATFFPASVPSAIGRCQ